MKGGILGTFGGGFGPSSGHMRADGIPQRAMTHQFTPPPPNDHAIFDMFFGIPDMSDVDT